MLPCRIDQAAASYDQRGCIVRERFESLLQIVCRCPDALNAIMQLVEAPVLPESSYGTDRKLQKKDFGSGICLLPGLAAELF